jgi:hypothetical protein
MSSAVRYFPTLDAAQITETLRSWKSELPAMGVLAMVPEQEQAGVAVLQAASASMGVPLTGGIFPELIRDDRFARHGCWLLRMDEAPFYVLQDNLPVDVDASAQAAEALAARVREQLGSSDTEATLFLLFDAMVPNISTLLDELYLKLANRVHYAGANAGSETFQPMPCLFDSRRIVGNGVLALLLKPHHGAILEHGYRLPEKSYTATATEGNRISHIDWRPAFEVYCELVRAQYGVEITQDNSYQYAAHFPFGIVRANHNVLVRIPVALGEDGSLACVGEVPAHSVLTLLQAPEPNSRHTVDALLTRLSTMNGGVSGRDLLLFYCAGRRMHLGQPEAEAEVRDVRVRSQAHQVVGALSLGEIGASSLRGYPLFHNATLVTALW